jgi:hypothetical protein
MGRRKDKKEGGREITVASGDKRIIDIDYSTPGQ